MKIIGTALLILVAASPAFADGMNANSTGAQGTQVKTQDTNGIVVHKSKKDDKSVTHSGAPQGAQGGQTQGGSN